MDNKQDRLLSEVYHLAEKYMAGTLTETERIRLEQLILASPATAEYCVTLGFTEMLLPMAAERIAGRAAPVRFYKTRVFSWVAGAIAAVLAVALGWQYTQHANDTDVVVSAHGQVPARATQAVGLQWEKGRTSMGARLASAEGAITAGLLELTLDSGVRILLEGPAAYTVTGANACRLHHGKAVVDVPSPAIGFVMEGARERIVDHGTRFAVAMNDDGQVATLGVLSGVVDVEQQSGKTMRLFTDYAVSRTGNSLESAPFFKDNFYREMPAREYPWRLERKSPDADLAEALSFDVTPLIHGPGTFRAVFKWLNGWGPVHMRSLTLKCGEKTVITRSLNSVMLGYYIPADSSQLLEIHPEDWRKERWVLTLDIVWPVWRPRQLITGESSMITNGVLQLAEGISLTARSEDFIGRWQYMVNGHNYIREFLSDGTMRVYRDNESQDLANGARWEVSRGVLISRNISEVTEYHMLQEDGALMFLNRNYRNAYRVKSERMGK